MADDDPVGVGADVTTILEGFLEGCCAAEVAALSLLRFVALFSFLELFRVTTPGEAKTGVVVVALMFEVLVLFDGALFTTSLLLSSLQSPMYSCQNPPESGRFREFRGMEF